MINKMEEVKQDLFHICEIMQVHGLNNESQLLNAYVKFLYNVIDDRTNDILHLERKLANNLEKLSIS